MRTCVLLLLRDQTSNQQQELLFTEACKWTCSAKPVEDIKVENKPGLHILVSFPQGYISWHLTQGAPSWESGSSAFCALFQGLSDRTSELLQILLTSHSTDEQESFPRSLDTLEMQTLIMRERLLPPVPTHRIQLSNSKQGNY